MIVASKWIKDNPLSCGRIMHMRASVIECQCPKCKHWCLKWSDVLDYDFCPHCGEDIEGENNA